MVRNEGVGGLYAGLSASILRQLTYSTTRFAIYDSIKARMLVETNGGGCNTVEVISLERAQGLGVDKGAGRALMYSVVGHQTALMADVKLHTNFRFATQPRCHSLGPSQRP